MKVVILAAGRGSRMNELTQNMPKALLEVSGKNLLEHKMDILPTEISRVVVVIGYQGQLIKDYLGSEYKGLPVDYVWDKDLDGTGGALFKAKEHLKSDPFLVMMGDDIYSQKDILRVLSYDRAMVVSRTDFLRRGGRVYVDNKGNLLDIVEGEHNTHDALVNTGLFKLQPDIFNYDLVKLEGRDEYGLPQTLLSAVKEGAKVNLVESSLWLPINSPEDIRRAENYFSG